MRKVLAILVILVCVVGSACGERKHGVLDAPCRADGTCDGALVCKMGQYNAHICVPPTEERQNGR